MLLYVCLGLFLPLIGFLLIGAASERISLKMASSLACATVFISFLNFLFLTVQVEEVVSLDLFNWIPLPGINANFTLHVDHLALLMTLIITGIGFLIHVYSIGYMEHEEDFARYFAFLNFFIFSMLLLVLAGNLILLFVGWEGVGLASYLLIGFWYHRPAAASAATKAFVINRIGDVGFLVGLLLTFYLFGTSDIAEISSRAGREFTVGAPIITLLTLLYFFAATGKSAQLPLYTWLPDAMEGPTPVSALIHAATMVTAGVYLIVRMHAIFLLAPFTLQVVGVIGAATALFAAICALGQTDLKRVLAFSTVSQLGLMFLACGAGAFYAAMFHLTTHAFIKALLFLSAGNVVHMMNGTTNMEKMGGLNKIFHKTHWLFLIGVLSLSGIPPFAAFFSKDLILEQEYLQGFTSLYYVGLAASILTSFYLMRAYCLTFTGKPRLEEKILKVAQEAPPVMWAPVSILALFSILGGCLGFALGTTPILEQYLKEIGITPIEKELSESFNLSFELGLAIGGSFLGMGLSALLYTRFYHLLGKPFLFLRRSFYIDELYRILFVVPLEKLSHFIAWWFEPKFFDASIQAAVLTVQKLSSSLQIMQSGQIRSYAAWMVLGSVLLIVYLVY